ncbi:MAG TPA: alpha/beta hydrolase [Chthonomonadaceae bacterium]|nr:alpha/beta hydrolase [Chthonomonadaceae bacterium]
MKTLSRALFTVLLLVCALGLARAEDQFFDSNGVKIRYIVEGKGEPVVLIHGFTSSIEGGWGNIIKPLSADFEVIALDCRGHGKSDKPTDPKMYGKEMGEDVIRLLDHLHIKKAHIIGYSMGAFITYNLLFAHPDRILTVTLGAGGGIPQPGSAELAKALADSLEKDKSFEPLIRALWPPEMAPPTPDQLKFFNQTLIGKRTDDDIKALAAVMRGGAADVPNFTKEELNAKLKAETIPIFGFVGSNDPLKKNLTELQVCMKDQQGEKCFMTLLVVDKGNHLDTMGKPETLKGIQDFLKAHQGLDKDK